MNWLCLPEPAADCSEHDCSDGGPSDMSSGNNTLPVSSPKESAMGYFIPLPSGAEMSGGLFKVEALTALQDWCTSLQRDSPVSRSVQQERETEAKVPGANGWTT